MGVGKEEGPEQQTAAKGHSWSRKAVAAAGRQGMRKCRRRAWAV